MKNLTYLFVALIGTVQIAWVALIIALAYYGVVFVKNEVIKQKVTPSMRQGVVQFRPCVWPNRCRTQS